MSLLDFIKVSRNAVVLSKIIRKPIGSSKDPHQPVSCMREWSLRVNGCIEIVILGKILYPSIIIVLPAFYARTIQMDAKVRHDEGF